MRTRARDERENRGGRGMESLSNLIPHTFKITFPRMSNVKMSVSSVSSCSRACTSQRVLIFLRSFYM